jgi:hypothetical protein
VFVLIYKELLAVQFEKGTSKSYGKILQKFFNGFSYLSSSDLG